AMLPPDKARRVNRHNPTDPDYQYRESWSLVAADGYGTVVSELAPALAVQLAPLPTIRLAAVGDINFDRSPAYIIQTTGDLAYPLPRVKDIFEAADSPVGNLECALCVIGAPAAKRIQYLPTP